MKAKSENKVQGRYSGSQLSESPRANTVTGARKSGMPTKGTEVKFDYSKAKLRG